MRLAISLLASFVLLAGPAVAADNGFYVGASVGQASYDISRGEIDDFVLEVFDLAGFPVVVGSSDLDDSDTAFSALVGYRFMPYLAVEAAWLDVGEASYTADGTVDAGEAGLIDARLSLGWSSSGPVLSVLGIWPITEQWELFGRAGVFFADTELEFGLSSEGVSAGESTSNSTEEFIGGVGVNFNFLESWTARLEYQMIPDLGDDEETGEADVDVISLGVLFQF